MSGPNSQTAPAPGDPATLAETITREDLRLRGCRSRSVDERTRLASLLYVRLHPAMAVLGIVFLLLVLAQGPLQEGSSLQRWLLGATWSLWAVFVAEYLLRLVIACDRRAFLRETWWQVLFLLIPVLTLFRALLILRAARPTRVALAALRGSRSARSALGGRLGWLAAITTINVFAGADILYGPGGLHPYGRALHAAALGAVTGEPTTSPTGIGQLLDVVLAVYAVIFFATLAGTVGAYFLEQRTLAVAPAADA